MFHSGNEATEIVSFPFCSSRKIKRLAGLLATRRGWRAAAARAIPGSPGEGPREQSRKRDGKVEEEARHKKEAWAVEL